VFDFAYLLLPLIYNSTLQEGVEFCKLFTLYYYYDELEFLREMDVFDLNFTVITMNYGYNALNLILLLRRRNESKIFNDYY